MTGLTDEQSYYWIYFEIYSSAFYWFLFMLIVVTALTPDVILKVIEEIYYQNGRKESVAQFLSRLNSVNKVEDLEEYRF